jgi:hypothetical protein
MPAGKEEEQMARPTRRRLLAILVGVAAALALGTQPALAAPPPNDDFDNAIVIPTLPFQDTQDTTDATTAPDDPDCVGRAHTVWYRFIPTTDATIVANTAGSNYDTTLSAYTGTRGSLIQIACNDDAIGLQSRIQFDVTAGTTYHLMAGSFDDSPGGSLVLTVQELPPPMALSVDLAPTGSVNRRGVATLHGTLTCSRPGAIDLTVGLRQRVSIGFAGTTVDCDGTERWRLQVVGETGRFRPGDAFGLAVARFQDPARGEVVTDRDDGTVRLRR